MRQDLSYYVSDMDVSKRILEIGPLANPIFTKRDANIFYADIRSTDEIKELYAKDSNVNVNDVCSIDFVIKDSYEKSLNHVDKFDYVVSSHVLEHVPRIIEFFQDIATILNKDGMLYFVLPDHRYCFDHFRVPTSFAEAYFIHSQDIKIPPWRVFDAALEYISLNDPRRLWSKDGIAKETLSRRNTFENAVKALDQVLEGQYVDAHFSVFSPKSFVLLLYNMINARLFPFRCTAFYPTEKIATTLPLSFNYARRCYR
jgi:SAM-dependent methyltransferase